MRSRTTFILCLLTGALVAPFALAAELPRDFRLEPVVGGLTEPSALASTPDGRILIAERTTGNLRVVDNGELSATPLCSVAVDSAGEGGLLGVAVDPDFLSTGWVYLYFTDLTSGNNKVRRFTATAKSCVDGTDILADLGSGGAALRNGGGLAFGPDGKLYVATGDMQDPGNGQDGGVLQGKVLRLNPDGTIPGDNPSAGSAVFTTGLRDPRGLAVHPGGQVYVTDNGDDAGSVYDELNAAAPGGNLGWDVETGPGGTLGLPLTAWLPTVGIHGAALFATGAFPDAAADGRDNDHDSRGDDGYPGKIQKDDNFLGECIGSANSGLPCSSDADCDPGRPGEVTHYCELRDDSAELCPGGTPLYDDDCDGIGAGGIDEPDESYLNSVFTAAGDSIRRAVPLPADPAGLSSWSTFLDSTFLPDCPTGWTGVMTGRDGFLYAVATNGGGGGGGALYRVIYDGDPEPREVSPAGSPFPLRIDKSGTEGEYLISWEDLRTEATQPRDNGSTSMAPEREYTIWKGTLGSYYSHGPIGGLDATPGTAVNDALRRTTVSVPAGESAYFLASARHANLEGTLGAAPSGTRPGYGTTDLCDTVGYHDQASGYPLWKCGRDFALLDEFGEEMSLSDHRGKVIVMDFAGVWCPPCQSQANFMEGFWAGVRDRDVTVMTVLMDENQQTANFLHRPVPAECRQWSDRADPFVDHTFPCVVDTQTGSPQLAWPNYNAFNALPTNVVLDTGMRVVYSAGGYNPTAITNAINGIVGATDVCLH